MLQKSSANTSLNCFNSTTTDLYLTSTDKNKIIEFNYKHTFKIHEKKHKFKHMFPKETTIRNSFFLKKYEIIDVLNEFIPKKIFKKWKMRVYPKDNDY